MAIEGGSDPLQEFFEACPDLLFVVGRDGAIRRLSAPLRELLGAEAREGTPLSAYVHPDDLRAFDVSWAALAESEANVTFDCRLRAADGAYGPWSLRARRSKAGGEIN
jgi:rsbT co-antagonist protein RsbR